MLRDRLGKLLVGRCHERDPAASEFFLPKQLKEFLTIRQTSRIQMNAAGDLMLQISTPANQPERQEQQGAGSALDEEKDALPEEIAPDQSAVLAVWVPATDPMRIIVAKGRVK